MMNHLSNYPTSGYASTTVGLDEETELVIAKTSDQRYTRLKATVSVVLDANLPHHDQHLLDLEKQLLEAAKKVRAYHDALAKP